MVEPNQKAPSFTLIDHNRNPVTLDQYINHKNIILSFHILSFTSGWTDQVSSFRIVNKEFEDNDTQVLGISTNAQATQAAYSASLGHIPYPILSDFHPHGEMSKLYGVYDSERGTSYRAIVIINKQGIVCFKRIYTSMSEFNMDEIRSEIQNIQWQQIKLPWIRFT